jgi:hypothetical protein
VSDVSDVESVLVSTLTQTIYPTGTANPSIVGARCKIYRGWPIPANLESDLIAGTVNISVFPQDNERNTTRYPREWQELPFSVPGLTLTVEGNTITVGGTVSSPLNAAAVVNRKGYVYPVQPNDTLSSIATGLAALINVNTPATSQGQVISIADPSVAVPPMTLQESGPLSRRFGGAVLASMAGFWPIHAMNLGLKGFWHKRFGGAILASEAAYWPTPSVGIVARVGAVGNVIREIKRQKRGFQITFWCPTPALRDAIAPVCDVALSALSYLSLPDGTAGRIIYERSHSSDRTEKQGLYRRDLIYSVEYGTTQTQSAAQIVTELFNIDGGLDPHEPPVESFYT